MCQVALETNQNNTVLHKLVLPRMNFITLTHWVFIVNSLTLKQSLPHNIKVVF